jgi:hypothetical protein
MLTLGLLQFSLAAKVQRTEGHLLRGNEVWKILKSPKFLFGTLIPRVSNSEGQVIKPLYTLLMNKTSNQRCLPCSVFNFKLFKT